MKKNKSIDYIEYSYTNTKFGFKVTRRIPNYESEKEKQSIRKEQTESCIRIYEKIKNRQNDT